jgi:hypothetical protein
MILLSSLRVLKLSDRTQLAGLAEVVHVKLLTGYIEQRGEKLNCSRREIVYESKGKGAGLFAVGVRLI